MNSNHRIASGRAALAALAAQVVGRGDPVVFLHAGICDSRMWRAQLDGVGGSTRRSRSPRGESWVRLAICS
jgi:pimeloyl-ACP methyl ester carboxylesterase